CIPHTIANMRYQKGPSPGEDCFVMRLVVRDIAQLDTLLDGLAEYAQCNTSVVKSSPVKRRLPPL
ncbi:hypothetical protein ACJOCH_22375, partial [Acinetobacter baumannii]